jgi:hypothetical protein
MNTIMLWAEYFAETLVIQGQTTFNTFAAGKSSTLTLLLTED